MSPDKIMVHTDVLGTYVLLSSVAAKQGNYGTYFNTFLYMNDERIVFEKDVVYAKSSELSIIKDLSIGFTIKDFRFVSCGNWGSMGFNIKIERTQQSIMKRTAYIYLTFDPRGHKMIIRSQNWLTEVRDLEPFYHYCKS